VDLAKRAFAAAIDAGAGAIAGLGAQVTGDQRVDGLRFPSRDLRHVRADFAEAPHLARPVAQQKRVEDIEAEEAGFPVIGPDHPVQTVEDHATETTVAQKRLPVLRRGEFRLDHVEPDQMAAGAIERWFD
jgi:hypothetical protein